MFESRRADWRWLAAIVLAAGIFYWPVLFGGQSFYYRDVCSIYYPQAALLKRALESGELPLWEPSIGLGYPFQADPHSMLLYPPSLLLHLLPLPRSYDLFTVAHVALGGIGFFLLLRRWRLSAPAAFLGAWAFMFSGFAVCTTMLTTLLRGLVWAPFAALAFDRHLETGGRSSLAAAALALALQGSGTDPQYVLSSFVLMAAAAWMRPERPALAAGQMLRSWLGAGALAFALLAYQYVPLAELIRNSVRMGGVAELAQFDVSPLSLPNLILPPAFPDPATPNHRSSYPRGDVPLYSDIYWGVPILALALASLGGSRRRAALVAAAVAIAGLLLALGNSTPVFAAVTALLPPLQVFRYPGKYFLLVAYAVPFLAAIGLDDLRGGMTHPARLLKRGLEAGAAVLALLLVALGTTGHTLPSLYLGDAPDFRLWERGDLLGRLHGAWMADLALALAVALGLRALVWLADREAVPRQSALACIAVAAAVNLAASTWRSYACAEDAFLTTPPKAAQWVGPVAAGQPPPRYATYYGKHGIVTPNRTVLLQYVLERELMGYMWGAIHGRNSVVGMMSVELATERAFTDLFAAQSRQARNQLVAAMGAQWVVRPPDPRGEAPFDRIAGRVGSSVVVQALDAVSPRVFVAESARPLALAERVPSLESVLSIRKEAVFEGDGRLRPKAVRRCSLARFERHRLEIDVDVEGEGLLVSLDAFYPGWRARVDGEERPILRVCGLVRGVAIRTGDRKVVMTYEPLSLKLGAWMSLAALAVLLGMARRVSS